MAQQHRAFPGCVVRTHFPELILDFEEMRKGERAIKPLGLTSGWRAGEGYVRRKSPGSGLATVKVRKLSELLSTVVEGSQRGFDGSLGDQQSQPFS